MCARLFLVAAIITATSRGGFAQTGTADGVAALARGDYQRAVEILKPIAEDPGTSDPAAQVFMAGLYETGGGVPADPLRACALYVRAASQQHHPLGRLAFALFATSIGRGLGFNHDCQLLASTGFDHGFEPATFDLGPGHAVEWTLREATVTYGGRTRRQPTPYAQPGARFLRLQHTELATGPTRSLTRHFFEVFVWYPSGRSGPWNLRWHIFEVIRDEVIRIGIPESLATVAGDAPPARESFDVRDYAVLRVDDAGNAEWAVLKGDRSTAERIESDAERREVRDTARARADALKGVDWNRRGDVTRQPAMTYADADGCGFMEIYGWTAGRDETMVVRVAGSELGLTTRPATFDLARESLNISVETYVHDRPQQRFEFCSDVRMPSAPDSTAPEIWRAVAGTISIELSSSGRRAIVTLHDVVLRNAAGRTVRLPRPVTLTALVGSVFG